LKCTDWVEDVFPKVLGFTKRVALIGDIQIDQYATSNLFHHWLENKQDGRVFIADGTAGQFDSQFSEGYYGFLENASIKLREIYVKDNR
jgi:hypothetical protein